MINILLDLDNTIICSLSKEEQDRVGGDTIKRLKKKLTFKELSDRYVIFERPGLQQFLSYLFDNFNVSVWTAASKDYALFIVDQFILTSCDRRLDYFLFDNHCRRSVKKSIDRNHKNLDLLNSEFSIPYDMERTFIIDDHELIYNSQPDRCLLVRPFELERVDRPEDDIELIDYVIPILETVISSV